MANGLVVTVTNEATVILDGGSGSGPEGHYGLENIGSQTVYLGGPSVTASGASKGKRLVPGQTANFALSRGDKLYGIVVSGTCDVDYLRLEP